MKIKTYDIVDNKFKYHNYRAIKTWEFRCPKKWEYFLSGAIPQAYMAYSDMTNEYHIARLVEVKREESYIVIT